MSCLVKRCQIFISSPIGNAARFGRGRVLRLDIREEPALYQGTRALAPPAGAAAASPLGHPLRRGCWLRRLFSSGAAARIYDGTRGRKRPRRRRSDRCVRKPALTLQQRTRRARPWLVMAPTARLAGPKKGAAEKSRKGAACASCTSPPLGPLQLSRAPGPAKASARCTIAGVQRPGASD